GNRRGGTGSSLGSGRVRPGTASTSRRRRQWDRVEPAVPAGSNPAGQSCFIPSTCLRPDPAPPVGAIDRSDAGSVVGGVLDGGLDVLEEFVDDGDAVGDPSLRAGEDRKSVV